MGERNEDPLTDRMPGFFQHCCRAVVVCGGDGVCQWPLVAYLCERPVERGVGGCTRFGFGDQVAVLWQFGECCGGPETGGDVGGGGVGSPGQPPGVQFGGNGLAGQVDGDQWAQREGEAAQAFVLRPRYAGPEPCGGLRPWKWCIGLELMRGFVPASGLVQRTPSITTFSWDAEPAGRGRSRHRPTMRWRGDERPEPPGRPPGGVVSWASRLGNHRVVGTRCRACGAPP